MQRYHEHFQGMLRKFGSYTHPRDLLHSQQLHLFPCIQEVPEDKEQ